MSNLLREFFHVLKHEKKWWLIPLVIILVLIGAVLILAGGSGISWALYPR